MKKISTISISGELTLNMHSLNNEGGEGNQILTRQVNIIDNNGKVTAVNAISGDMFKHIQAEHLYLSAKTKRLPLCQSCLDFNANRIAGDKDFINEYKSKKNHEVVEGLIKKCVVDDLEGILVTEANTPRKSVVEFGWITGIPEKVKTDSYFHVKYVKDSGVKEEEASEGSNLGQNIFYRPASSGAYALVSHIEAYRIGFNDISRVYNLDAAERQERFKVLLESILYTFLKPRGAMKSTQHPHISDFKGVVAVSTSAVPAPTVSALNPGYLEEIHKISHTLNRIEDGAVEIFPFHGLSDFTEVMGLLMDREPIELG